MFATSGKARLAYDVTGDGSSGADVLLLHAGVTDRRSWAPVVERLSPRHRCVAYDARQYGETTYEPQDGWSWVADAVAVMDAAGLDRPVLVAGSMGGAAAIDTAILHPDRVAALVLIGPAVHGAPYPDITEEPTATLVARVEEAEEADDQPTLNTLEAWMWLDGPTAPEGRVGGALRDLFLDMNGRALAAADPGEIEPYIDAWSRLSEIAVPTLVLVGRLDMPDIKAVDEQLAERIAGSRLEWLDDTAHLPHFEAHERCVSEVSAFVDEVAGV